MREKETPTIITVGAAVQDVFLSGKVFTPQIEDGEKVEEFKVGEKYELEDVTYSTGGGATNAAVTFTRQGLHASYMGKIGDDPAGKIVLDDLHREGVDTTLVKVDEHLNTGYSTLLLAPDGGRTVLVYRGASEHFEVEDFDLHNARADWFYISSLAGNMDVLETLIEHTEANNIKVAINPGKGELKEPERLKKLMSKFTMLSLNKEEMQTLVAGETIEELAKNAAAIMPCAVVTDGPRGEAASDGEKIYVGGMYEDVPVIDRTGAGDAFASGFTAMLALGKSIPEAIVFGSANSTSVVGQIGAKAGILRAHARLHDMPIEIKPV